MNPILGETAREIKRNAQPPDEVVKWRRGKITAVSGATAKFSIGEGTASAHFWPCLASYTPVVNDQVNILQAGGTYLILGKNG